MEKYCKTGQDKDDNITRRMRFACRINKAPDTHSEGYVILIAFSRQQWLRERASMLRYIYITCLVLFFGGPRPSLGPNQRPIQWAPKILSRVVMQLESECTQSVP